MQAHNLLWQRVGKDARDVFGPEIRALSTELEREQIGRQFRIEFFGVPSTRKVIKELRAFSEVRGPLTRD